MVTGVLIAIAFALLLARLFCRNPENYPPGPFPWPIVGNLYLLRDLSRKLKAQHFALLKLSQQYDSPVISLRLGGNNVIAVSGLEGIHEVLNGEEFDGRPWNEFIKLRNMGLKKGITMADGPEWKEIRAWVVKSLKNSGFGRPEMSDMIKSELAQTLETLKKGGVFRLKPIVGAAVINVLWTFVAGKEISNTINRFQNLMERRAAIFDMSGGILSSFPWIRYVAPEWSGYNILVTMNNELKNVIVETIEDHKRNYVAGSEADLIDMFLTEIYARNGDSTVYTEEQLILILVDLFIASLHTSTLTLDFLFLNMAMNLDQQRRLHQELDNVLEKESLPELSDRPKLPYIEAVLAESQRISLVVPIIGPRRVLKDTKLLGYSIPKDTSVLINIFSIHMDPTLFPEPEVFKPERFLKNGAYQPDDNIMPFGKGKRRCPGEALARAALFLIFAGIMQRFEIRPVPGKEPLTREIIPGITLSPKPYEVLLVPRHTS
ncbi:probable cytochrome P450 305a1 [Orussus abietinus]|uniref:probable cytochrome P450 305a1 n=1 Tax=Orussus abietinus TaxID=222816 RepID=UPI000625B593|nr:probable cytochrome P450 305a1 [Orussus abietinus]